MIAACGCARRNAVALEDVDEAADSSSRKMTASADGCFIVHCTVCGMNTVADHQYSGGNRDMGKGIISEGQKDIE